MPIPFDKFRLLNGTGGRFRNESTKTVYAKRDENDPSPVVIPPGAEEDLPQSPEVIIEVEQSEP